VSDLDPSTRSFLDKALAEEQPSRARLSRLESDFERRVGVAAFAATVGLTSTAGAASAGAGLGLWGKVVIGLAIVGTVGGSGAWIARTHGRHAKVAAAPAPSVVAQPVTSASQADVPNVTPPDPIASLAIANSDPPPAPAKNTVSRRVGTRASASHSASQPALLEELRLIGQAHAALNAGDPSGALAVLGEHAARFPKGQLASDRENLRVLAGCMLGDAQAKRRAETLVNVNPSSAISKRMRDACKL
jgi:hypothetical protein